jgi:hypothetical protein
VKARIYLDDGLIYARLENGALLYDADPVELADQLWSKNVSHDELELVGWHLDPDRALLIGQQIAIHARFRFHQKTSRSTSSQQ